MIQNSFEILVWVSRTAWKAEATAAPSPVRNPRTKRSVYRPERNTRSMSRSQAIRRVGAGKQASAPRSVQTHLKIITDK